MKTLRQLRPLIACTMLLVPLTSGCVGTKKAQAYAAVRSECPAEKVKEVSQDGYHAVLDVCGVHERWEWDGINGWLYAGPAADQPVAAVTPTAPPPPIDHDHDGIVDAADACPTVAGVSSLDPTKNGCPAPVDSDSDGVFDDQDACPQEKGVANADPKKNGCPLRDEDGDGVADDVDACPKIAGITTTDPATNGCPGDRDGDTVRDDKDACPDKAGVPSDNPDVSGCPKGAVIVTETQVVINDRIEFAVGKSVIRRESFPLLDSIATVLKDHPEILKLEIQGHTDNTGPKYLNTMLSDRRAKAVLRALVQRGVKAGRLTAKGYGPSVPIASNDTDEGKQKNRRVQFNITEKKAVAPKVVPVPAAAPTPPT